TASTVGGTVLSAHAERIEVTPVGESNGQPGQRHTMPRGAMVWLGQDPIVEVATDDGWESWRIVDSFADCAPDDEVVVVDPASGAIEFAPLVRFPDGSVRGYGAIPPQRAAIRVREHAVGGGAAGNVPANAIRTLKSSIPFIRSVTNRQP